jgi:hypothetical protein
MPTMPTLPTSTTLVVCHETGRTEALMAVVRALLTKTNEKITFLMVGLAAKNYYDNLPASDSIKTSTTMVHLGSFFQDQLEIDEIEKNPLTPAQLNTIKTEFLDKITIAKVIIGAPSWLNAFAPFQIAEVIAPRLNPGDAYIYDGDFYKELNCVNWTVIERPEIQENDWRKTYTWLVPLPVAQELIERISPFLKKHVRIVGDPSIDIAINKIAVSDAEKQKILKELNIQSTQVFLFLSGSKVVNDDAALLTKILDKKTSNSTQIRIAPHPGCLEIDTYIQTLLDLIKTYDASNVKIVVGNDGLNPVNPSLLQNDKIINSNTKRSVLMWVADGLACAIPGTQATQAAIYGIPTYYDRENQISYLADTRINSGAQGLIKFITATQLKRKLPKLSKKDLGLTEDPTAQLVAECILKKKVSALIKYSLYAAAILTVGAAVYWQNSADKQVTNLPRP